MDPPLAAPHPVPARRGRGSLLHVRVRVGTPERGSRADCSTGKRLYDVRGLHDGRTRDMSLKGPLPDRWDDARAAALAELERLLYRSNLLGSDLRITNYGGGNTSAKVEAKDPLTGKEVGVLWVKGSGGDLGSLKMDGFATLYLDKLASLKSVYRGREHEDEMADYFAHCAFNLNPRATSIDTPPHCFIPAKHVDHMHADAVIAIAAAEHDER